MIISSLLSKEGRGLGCGFSNPQPNPQFLYPCATYAAFGSPRVLVSGCKTISRRAVTAEAAGSSPVVPAILFKHFQT